MIEHVKAGKPKIAFTAIFFESEMVTILLFPTELARTWQKLWNVRPVNRI